MRWCDAMMVSWEILVTQLPAERECVCVCGVWSAAAAPHKIYWTSKSWECGAIERKNYMIHGSRIYYGYFMDFFITKLLLLWSQCFSPSLSFTLPSAACKKPCRKYQHLKCEQKGRETVRRRKKNIGHFLLISFLLRNILRCQFYHYQV